YSIFADSGLGLGLHHCLYDGENNRLLVVEHQLNAPIKAVSLDDGWVTEVVSTSIDNLEGITMDDLGNVYVGSWAGTGEIYKFTAGFGDPPELLSSEHHSPLGIDYNREDFVLAVAVYDSNRVDFVLDP
ncbi:MAG: hypothetical protein GY869_04930, partial [Planctomycetes bacterium]|nr:hypothetical protein [Planctomycetota bacterium]